MTDPEPVTRKRATGFMSLPSTTPGAWSTRLLLVSLALIVLNMLVVLPAIEQRASFDLLRQAYSFTIVLCLLSSGITGLVSLVSKHERSWTVMLAVVIAGAAVAFLISDIVIPG